MLKLKIVAADVRSVDVVPEVGLTLPLRLHAALLLVLWNETVAEERLRWRALKPKPTLRV